ncbi:hypothetical protein GOV08_01945 [Candidatus Woesearchaeota archaeon]|nr:hypothetical protein [Candidatus Woesearchaeota archaeon]
MKEKLILVALLVGLIFMFGCDQLQLGTGGEQLICVPAANISKICEQLGVEDSSLITGDVVDEIEEIDAEIGAELDEIIEEIDEATVEEDIVEEEVIEADYTVTEGELLQVTESAADPDGDLLTLTYGEPLDETGAWQTQVGDAGVYVVEVTASDGENSAAKTVIIQVLEKGNSAPTIEGVEDLTVAEGDTVTVTPVVNDADEDEVTVTISEPLGDDGVWETGFDDAGEYELTVTASDGTEEAVATAVLTVENTNRAPLIESLTAAQVDEGGLVTVNVVVSDPDNDSVEVSFGEPLDAQGQWQTQVGDAGEYVVSVTAFDGDLIDTKTISISINAVNQPPVLEELADLSVNEGDTATVEVVASDPEGTELALSISEPVGDDGVWETGFDDAGEYEITVTADDGENQVSVSFTLTVVEKNRPPVFE